MERRGHVEKIVWKESSADLQIDYGEGLKLLA
jgi:hypothetical protein